MQHPIISFILHLSKGAYLPYNRPHLPTNEPHLHPLHIRLRRCERRSVVDGASEAVWAQEDDVQTFAQSAKVFRPRPPI